MSAIVYTYKNAIYINLTNNCPCACVYCIKNKWRGLFRGHNLKVLREPSCEEVVFEIRKIAAFPSENSYKEIVFCGYGEPFMRYDVLNETARVLKSAGWKIRVNTTGLAEASDKKNGAGRSLEVLLGGLINVVDAFSVSLNAADADDYTRNNRPLPDLFADGKNAFYSALDFIKKAVQFGFDVTVTAVRLPGLNIDAVSEIAAQLGAKFRPRDYLDEYEDR